VHVDIELTGDKSSSAMAWDEAAATEALDRLAAFARSRRFRSSQRRSCSGRWRTRSGDPPSGPSSEAAEPVLTAALNKALRAFSAMRAKEGEALLIDFIKRSELLHRQVEAIAARAPKVPADYREQLLEAAAGRRAGAGSERRAGAARDRAVRRSLRCNRGAHAAATTSNGSRPLLKSEGEIGRRSEFLLQEIGREVNTIGSKANDLTIARAVIELKNELERVREQIANVE
jgi:uncharacterized protein (TIGR00255 family)